MQVATTCTYVSPHTQVKIQHSFFCVFYSLLPDEFYWNNCAFLLRQFSTHIFSQLTVFFVYWSQWNDWEYTIIVFPLIHLHPFPPVLCIVLLCLFARCLNMSVCMCSYRVPKNHLLLQHGGFSLLFFRCCLLRLKRIKNSYFTALSYFHYISYTGCDDLMSAN